MEMVDFFILFILILASYWVLVYIFAYSIAGTFYAAQKPQYILYKLRLSIENRLGKYWSKPFLSCFKCMPSLHAGFPMFIALSTGFIHLYYIGKLDTRFVDIVVSLVAVSYIPVLFTSSVSFLVSRLVASYEKDVLQTITNPESSAFSETLDTATHLLSQDG